MVEEISEFFLIIVIVIVFLLLKPSIWSTTLSICVPLSGPDDQISGEPDKAAGKYTLFRCTYNQINVLLEMFFIHRRRWRMRNPA